MPDREFIHAREDVLEAFRCAKALGLQVLPGGARADNATEPLGLDAMESSDHGVFLLFRPDWIEAPLQVMRIETGVNEGKYVVKPNVNFAAITLYFQGEGLLAGRRRLGAGTISFKREWLYERHNQMRASPREVKQAFDAICKHIFSREIIQASGHRYIICKRAALIASSGKSAPPFDFIPWPPDLSTT